jgi:hypothetical protein
MEQDVADIRAYMTGRMPEKEKATLKKDGLSKKRKP